MVIDTQATEQDFEQFISTVNNLMDHMRTKSLFRYRPSDRWEPAINLYESCNEYVVCLDLAGIDPKKVDVHAEPGQLRISGSRSTPTAPGGRPCTKIHVMEIDNGPFHRIVQLSEDVDLDRIKARYKEGLLWILLPKT